MTVLAISEGFFHGEKLFGEYFNLVKKVPKIRTRYYNKLAMR